MANSIFFISLQHEKRFNMGKILFLMFTAFIMILALMVVSEFLNKWYNKPSKEESRDSFVKDLDELAEMIKNKQTNR